MSKLSIDILKKDIDYLTQSHNELKADVKEIKTIFMNGDGKIKEHRVQLENMEKNLAWNWRVTLGIAGLIGGIVAFIQILK